MIVFPFPPNWATPVIQGFDFKSQVLRADDGNEQRRALRQQPRLSYEYDLWQRGRDADRLEMLLRAKNNEDILLPEWIHASRLTSSVSSAATSLPLDTVDRSFRAGEYLVIYSSTTGYEAVQIDSLTDEEIVTVDPIANAWSEDTRVYPAVLGRFPYTLPTQRHTSTVVSGRMSFLAHPNSVPYLTDGTAAVTYDGLEVLTTPLDWKSPINNDFTRELRTADAEVGPISYFEKDSSTRVVRPIGFMHKSKAANANFRQFIKRRMGQVKPCWIPSWHRDFNVVDTSGPSTAALTVEGQEVLALLDSDETQDRLRIRLTDGTVFYRQIVSLIANGNNTVIGLNASFGISVGPTNINSVDWLLRCRLVTDKIEVPWLTSTVTNPTLTFTTVNA